MSVSRAVRNQLNTLVGKAFKMAEKGKIFIADVVRNLIKESNPSFSTKDDPQMQLTKYLLQKIMNIKELQQASKAAMTLLQQFFAALGVTIGSKLKNQFQLLLKKILQSGVDQQNVINIWHENVKSYDCICGKIHNGSEVHQKKQEVCYKCGKICRLSCFWQKDQTDSFYECPGCFLLHCIPEKIVKNVIFLGYLRYNNKQKSTLHSIKFYFDIKSDENDYLQLRCCRLNKKTRYEITFPQNCDIYLGTKKIIEFKSLSLNSPLKRRNDQQVIINKSSLTNLNTLKIQQQNDNFENYRGLPSDHHLFIIVKTTPIQMAKLQRFYFQKRFTIQQSKQILNQYLSKSSHGLVVEKLTISMKCQYYQTYIRHPARSKNCTTHYQPFDMLSMIYASMASKNSVQKWKCPICKKRAYDLFVDDYLCSLIEGRAKVSDITFNASGNAVINENPDDDLDQSIEKAADEEKQQSKGLQLLDLQKNKTSNEIAEVIDLLNSDQEYVQSTAKRGPQKQVTNEIESKGRKIRNKSFPGQQNSIISIDQCSPNEEPQKLHSRSFILEKIKEKLSQKSKQNIEISNRARQEEEKKDMKSIGEFISLVEGQRHQKRQNENKQQSNKPTIKSQYQLLMQAAQMLKKNNNYVISQSEQIIFNAMCRQLLDFNISD